VQCPDQITDSTRLSARLKFTFAEIEQAIGGTAITHLVIEAGQSDIIALTQTAVLIRQPFGYDEE